MVKFVRVTIVCPSVTISDLILLFSNQTVLVKVEPSGLVIIMSYLQEVITSALPRISARLSPAAVVVVEVEVVVVNVVGVVVGVVVVEVVDVVDVVVEVGVEVVAGVEVDVVAVVCEVVVDVV